MILLLIIGTIIAKDFEAMRGGVILLVVFIVFLAVSYNAKKKHTVAKQGSKDDYLKHKIDSLKVYYSSTFLHLTDLFDEMEIEWADIFRAAIINELVENHKNLRGIGLMSMTC